MPKQLKAAGGHVVDIVGELEHDGVEYYAVHYRVRDEKRDPFLVRKDNPNYTPYDLSGVTPQAGDVVSSGQRWAEYRVLGVIDGQMLIVRKEDYADGEWITLPKGQLQEDIRLDVDVYIRPCPDDYLKVVERP